MIYLSDEMFDFSLIGSFSAFFNFFSVSNYPFDSWKMSWFGILGSLFTTKGTQSNVFMVLSNNNNINEENNEDCIVKIIGEPI